MTDSKTIARTVEKMAGDQGAYPIDAYWFVQHGLQFAATQTFGPADAGTPKGSRHISGQQLCHGLRDFAFSKWGPLARTVLTLWNIRSTEDFGRIVFALIDADIFQKRSQDSIDDFRDVFDFRLAFGEYKIELK